ncbi:hypothetical protein JX265_006127 [Neoarthrinium moseri]|uniref:Rhodopsin domain-containing protein n=1 Tax=Neoarthrinium moseri TaxID=1658444 RepID=A0A9P9WN22_9PEZI|nr:uncharacterized protein JN550_004343 [Neoarthrinium moseri]KAI1840663.1 hypothetical protein JX266_013125 [Neoarthrinium moseri]KAI1871087.1 hypothetical protein JX265_006127 [Neoarthrinium moseri]KAI1872140.1 hypothetical protein JN550_004343 [Neoarthrinium moseri]
MMHFSVERPMQVAVVAVSAVCLVLPTVSIFLRLLARRIAHRTLDISDYLMVAAWLLASGFQIVCFFGVLHFGVGYHSSEIKAWYGSRATEGFSIGLWALSLSCCKLSVLLLYRKLFPVRSVTIAVDVSIVLIFLFLLVAVLGGCLICQPFAYNWDKTIEGGHCGDLVGIIKTTGAGNVITDVAALIVALPSIFGLQLPLYKKIVLMATFGLGVVTVIVSIFRLATLITVDFDDLTYTCTEALIFTAIEPALAIVLSNIPMLRPLLKRGKYSANGTASPMFSLKPRSATKRSTNIGAFEPLSDDSSQYQLRPLGTKHNVQISVDREDGRPDSHERQPSPSSDQQRAITIRQDWEVRQEVDIISKT